MTKVIISSRAKTTVKEPNKKINRIHHQEISIKPASLNKINPAVSKVVKDIE